MPGRLAGKMAVVVGAGQTPGETIGNGRATAILFAREGATVLCVDRRLASAEETVAMIVQRGRPGQRLRGRHHRRGRLRGAGRRSQGAAGPHRHPAQQRRHRRCATARSPGCEEADFDRIITTNLKGMWLTIKHVLPVMREQGGGGSIVNISSMAAVASSNLVAYGMSKAGVNKLTHITAAGEHPST